jgi:ABC-type transporter Mla MlaB component
MVVLDCAQIAEPSLEVVEHICRLRLGLKRAGRDLQLANVPDELRALLDLCGLGVEVERQPEEREQPGGVEEERDLADPPG